MYHSSCAEVRSRSVDQVLKTQDCEQHEAVIITLSWIPLHPSTHMLETVLNSTARLRGLLPTAPIAITVDYFCLRDLANAAAVEQMLTALE